MQNTAISVRQRTRSVSFRMPYNIYESCCEMAEQLDLNLTDYFLMKLKTGNTDSLPSVIQPVMQKQAAPQPSTTYSDQKNDTDYLIDTRSIKNKLKAVMDEIIDEDGLDIDGHINSLQTINK